MFTSFIRELIVTNIIDISYISGNEIMLSGFCSNCQSEESKDEL